MNTASGGAANLVVSGAGSMNISNPAATILIGATSDANSRTFNLDLSGLTGGLTTQVANFYVGRTTATYNNVPNATVKLAPGSNISAVNFSIGDDNGNGGSGGGQSTTVTMAGGTNFLKTTTLTVGRIKSGTHTLNFAPGGGTLALSGTSGGALGTMYVGYKPHTGSSSNVTGVTDFSNGTVTGSIGNLYVGHMTSSQGSNSPKAVGTFTLGTSSSNNLTVTNLNIGTSSGSNVPTSAKYSDGTVNLRGGKWTVTTVDMTSEQYSFARLKITGGTMTVSNVITGSPGSPGGPGGNETLTLNGGTLDMTGHAIGDATNTVSTLNFQRGTLTNVTSINGTAGLTKTTAGTLTLDGTMGYTGVTTISAGTLRIGAASGTNTSTSLAASSSIVNNATLIFRRTDAAEADVAGSISGTGSALYEGSGTSNQSRYTGNSACTYSGGTTISNARVNLTTATGFGSGAVTINSGGTAFINGAGTVANPFTLAGNGWIESAGQLGALRLATGSVLTGPITLAANTRIAVSSAGTATISSPISGAFALELGEDTATGTLNLNGTHTYTGSTNVTAGRLALGGSLTSAISASSGSTLAPIGLASTTGNVAVPAGAIFQVQLNGATVGTRYDRLTAGGSGTLGGTLNVIPGSNLTPGTTFTILSKTSAGAVSGTFAGLANNATFTAGGETFGISYTGGDGNDVVVTLLGSQLEQWRYANFGSMLDTGAVADLTDANGEGEVNLIEFATAQNPNATTLATTGLVNNGAVLEFTYTRSKAAVLEGIVFTVEWSDTLEAGIWSTNGIANQNPPPVAQNAETETLKIPVPAGGGGKRFVRLKVAKP